MIRAFIGLPLPKAYQDLLREFRKKWQPRFAAKMSWTRPENWHLTLKFLGNVNDEELPAMKAALADILFTAFPLQGGQGGFFPPKGKPRVFWLGLGQGADACRNLATQIEAAVEPLGFEPEKRTFSPHLTLARVKPGNRGGRHAPSAANDPWPEALADAAAQPWPQHIADRFILWQSDLQPSGPVYTPLAEYQGKNVNG
ncbi:MAG: RNA 2',3'-cyclic phosphodiesterase [Desulfovibrio sp.]|nr:MAG: RNA 2',3'-cyclic phosphodiesterase [Desulfovibrio sp.]